MSSIFKRGWINLSIHMGIESFGNYIEEMENNLNNQLKKLEKQYIEETQHVSKDEAENIFEYQYEDQIFYLRDEFPNILRKSFVISLYSFLEQQLVSICKHIEKDKNLDICLDDIKKDKGIFKSYTYLSDVAKIDFTNLKEEWEKIKKINKIRNHFVHNDSDTLDMVVKPKNHKERNSYQIIEAFTSFNIAIEDKIYNKLQETMEDNEILKYDIKITNDFCNETLIIIKNFFDKLTDSLKLY